MRKYCLNLLILFFLFASYHIAFAQTAPSQSLLLPVDIPPNLSANFGELRPNHFHAGIDFKTQGVVGKNIMAIDSGYVSRVQVRPSGYGLVVYIMHYNGLSSVYAHLLSFNPRIDNLVKNYQYTHKKNIVDISFLPHELPVARGEIIGLSGNTGSSGGPHLHFEIRDAKTQNALNPLLFYPQIVDKARPKISNIGVYAMDSNSYVNRARTKHFFAAIPTSQPGVYTIASPVHIYGNIGFAIHGHDAMQGQANVYGYHSVTLLCNDSVYYSRTIDEISFATTGDINSLIDYAEREKSKRYFEKAYVEKNNELEIYTSLRNNGIYTTTENDTVLCEFLVSDFNQNMAVVKFTLIQKAVADSIIKKLPAYPQKNNCLEDFEYSHAEFRFVAPQRTFFHDFTFSAKVDSLNSKRYYSKRHTISSDQILFKKQAKISIQARVPSHLLPKAIIECTSPGGSRSAVLTKIDEQGVAHASIKRIGTYAVIVDTVPPVITPNFVNGANLQNARSLSFKMSDNFSGIGEYHAYVDNSWVILDYDAKSATVYLRFDDARIEGKNMNHQLKIIVSDLCGNKTEKLYSFFR